MVEAVVFVVYILDSQHRMSVNLAAKDGIFIRIIYLLILFVLDIVYADTVVGKQKTEGKKNAVIYQGAVVQAFPPPRRG